MIKCLFDKSSNKIFPNFVIQEFQKKNKKIKSITFYNIQQINEVKKFYSRINNFVKLFLKYYFFFSSIFVNNYWKEDSGKNQENGKLGCDIDEKQKLFFFFFTTSLFFFFVFFWNPELKKKEEVCINWIFIHLITCLLYLTLAYIIYNFII